MKGGGVKRKDKGKKNIFHFVHFLYHYVTNAIVMIVMITVGWYYQPVIWNFHILFTSAPLDKQIYTYHVEGTDPPDQTKKNHTPLQFGCRTTKNLYNLRIRFSWKCYQCILCTFYELCANHVYLQCIQCQFYQNINGEIIFVINQILTVLHWYNGP